MAFNVTQTLGALTLPFPDAPGYQCVTKRGQVQQQTFGGAVRTADRDVSWYETTFTVTIPHDIASDEDMVALEAFWDDTAKGGLNSFTWTDILGTAHNNARFLDAELDAKPLAGNLYRVTLRLRTDERVF